MSLIPCAFCKGTGKDPFNLLSKLATCQVCRGTGKVRIKEPISKCAYCKSTGVYPQGTRITCTVCNGKGSIRVKGVIEECSKCGGTGHEVDSGLPCIECRGEGIISKR